MSNINQAVVKDPKLALRDPYGEGWLVTVQAPNAKTSFRNLLGGALARWWTEESASRLQRRMPMALAGALAQDGGVAVDDGPPRSLTRNGCRWRKSSSCHKSREANRLAEGCCGLPAARIQHPGGRCFLGRARL